MLNCVSLFVRSPNMYVVVGPPLMLRCTRWFVHFDHRSDEAAKNFFASSAEG